MLQYCFTLSLHIFGNFFYLNEIFKLGKDHIHKEYSQLEHHHDDTHWSHSSHKSFRKRNKTIKLALRKKAFPPNLTSRFSLVEMLWHNRNPSVMSTSRQFCSWCFIADFVQHTPPGMQWSVSSSTQTNTFTCACLRYLLVDFSRRCQPHANRKEKTNKNHRHYYYWSNFHEHKWATLLVSITN